MTILRFKKFYSWMSVSSCF